MTEGSVPPGVSKEDAKFLLEKALELYRLRNDIRWNADHKERFKDVVEQLVEGYAWLLGVSAPPGPDTPLEPPGG